MSTPKRLAQQRLRRAWRVRRHVRGDAERPRVSVHRTSKHVYVQVLDDREGRTLCAVSSRSLKLPYGGNVAAARAVGEELARRAADLRIRKVAFDRGAYRYHGRVKALAEALRSGGLDF